MILILWAHKIKCKTMRWSFLSSCYENVVIFDDLDCKIYVGCNVIIIIELSNVDQGSCLQIIKYEGGL